MIDLYFYQTQEVEEKGVRKCSTINAIIENNVLKLVLEPTTHINEYAFRDRYNSCTWPVLSHSRYLYFSLLITNCQQFLFVCKLIKCVSRVLMQWAEFVSNILKFSAQLQQIVNFKFFPVNSTLISLSSFASKIKKI